MDKVSGRLTVFFEEPFWIGVFEHISEKKLSVCKVTFGAEPKDYETGTEGCAETGTEHWDRNEVATGFEITAGAV